MRAPNHPPQRPAPLGRRLCPPLLMPGLLFALSAGRHPPDRLCPDPAGSLRPQAHSGTPRERPSAPRERPSRLAAAPGQQRHTPRAGRWPQLRCRPRPAAAQRVPWTEARHDCACGCERASSGRTPPCPRHTRLWLRSRRHRGTASRRCRTSSLPTRPPRRRLVGRAARSRADDGHRAAEPRHQRPALLDVRRRRPAQRASEVRPRLFAAAAGARELLGAVSEPSP